MLAINAEWGFGKTFMLERWQQELSSENYPVVYFDAWKNDFTPKPLVAFISELDSSLSGFLTTSEKARYYVREFRDSAKRILMPTLKVALSVGAKHILGAGINQLSEAYSDAAEHEASHRSAHHLDAKRY